MVLLVIWHDNIMTICTFLLRAKIWGTGRGYRKQEASSCVPQPCSPGLLHEQSDWKFAGPHHHVWIGRWLLQLCPWILPALALPTVFTCSSQSIVISSSTTHMSVSDACNKPVHYSLLCSTFLLLDSNMLLKNLTSPTARADIPWFVFVSEDHAVTKDQTLTNYETVVL